MTLSFHVMLKPCRREVCLKILYYFKSYWLTCYFLGGACVRSLVVVGQVFIWQTLVANILEYLHQTVTVQVELDTTGITDSNNIKQLVKQDENTHFMP